MTANILSSADYARFPLSADTQDTRAFARLVIGFGAAVAVLAVMLVPTGVADGAQAASGAITALIICVGLTIGFRALRRLSGGEVLIDREGVTLAFRLHVAMYPWRDIERVRDTPTIPTGLYGLMIRITRAANKDGTVELDLRRPHRIGPTSGTDAIGISTGLKKIRLHIGNPDRFMSIAKQYLSP